jgi:hypothetical protein
VIEIPLTQGKVALVDDEDAHLAEFKWHACRIKRNWYAYRNVRLPSGRGTTQKMHRVILDPGHGRQVDHVNGDGLDNRRANLRPATNAENTRCGRMRSSNTSGYRGVVWAKWAGRWRAQITVDGRLISLGYFADPVDAARAYDAAAVKHFGAFARPNLQETK